jgi:hypothetical protein
VAKKPTTMSGFYSASEAMKRLGMSRSTFFEYVKEGRIKRTVPPTRKEGYYEKVYIDKMVQDNALFVLVHSIEPITFGRAQSEDDLRGIVDLCLAIYGQGGTPNYNARLEIWQKNPEVYYIVKQEDIVVGYISMIWFAPEALATMMGPTPKHSRVTSGGTGIYSVIGPDTVFPFVEGEPIDNLFVSLGVRPGLSNTEQREYAFKLLRGTQDVFVNFAERGMPIGKLYATSERGDGKTLARKLHMKEIQYDNDPILRYELDVETADSMLLHPYKEALARTRSHTK